MARSFFNCVTISWASSRADFSPRRKKDSAGFLAVGQIAFNGLILSPVLDEAHLSLQAGPDVPPIHARSQCSF